MTLVADLSGNSFGVDPNFSSSGFVLARNLSMAGNTNSNPIGGILERQYQGKGANFIWDARFTGTSLKLQSQSIDGSWNDVATQNASGAMSVYIGAGSAVRLANPNASVVNVSASTLS